MTINNWQTKKLGELAEYINGYSFKPTDWVSSGCPIIRIQNLNDENKEYHYFNGDIGEKYRVRKGDILISWSASLGSYIWDRDDAWLNQHIFKVLINESEVDRDFFYFLSMTILEEMRRKTHGGTMKHITKDLFENIQVQVPPLFIQQQIVEKLDAIRKLQELNNKEIERAEELFESLLSNLLRPQENWETLRLDELTRVVTKGTTPTTYGYSFTSDGVPFLRVENINNDVVDPSSTTHYIDESTNKMLNRSRTQPNDVLVTIAGTIGRVGYVPIDAPEMNMNQAVAIIRTNPKLLNFLYLFYLLQSKEIQRQMMGARVTGTITNISLATLRNLVIPVLPIDKQLEVVMQLDSVSMHKQQLSVLRDKFLELFESTLSKAMKGELIS